MTSCIVLDPIIQGQGADHEVRRLSEIVGLTSAIDLDVKQASTIRVAKPIPATLLGRGRVEEVANLRSALDADLVVVNAALSPAQQRNLERLWSAKVVDRTGLILEIFGRRARTREGVMQVDLAHLTYQKSRLVRSWTHLERQRGGAGFMGGPGERQIEADRRMIDQKITRIRRQLEKVVKTRKLHRKSRKKTPYPIVVLVGYTNAGKSTLFNQLTGAEVLAADMLFATLDPTMRQIDLPSGRPAILSDTVGFISDLPTELIASFRATLEEVLEADLILHVHDVSSPLVSEEAREVHLVLESIGVPNDAAAIEVLNKIDLAEGENPSRLHGSNTESPRVNVSALSGIGCDELLQKIEEAIYPDQEEVHLSLRHGDGAALSWLYDHGSVESRCDTEQTVELVTRLTPKAFQQFRKQFPR